jgi:lipopolysaccharide biosynthesis glycosyltransferase
MFFQDIVQSQTEWGDQALKTFPGSLHVAFGIDKNYARCMGVLMLSLLEANPDSPLVFHVFAESIEPTDRQKIASLTLNSQACVILYTLNSSALSRLPSAGHYSTAVYNRIVMPVVLSETTPRVLYLDSDIICLGPITGLTAWDMQGKTVAAVMDVDRVAAEKINELKLQHDFYFNSGVMWIDTVKWTQAGLSEQIVKVLAANDQGFSLVDQDALNIVLDGNVAALPPHWNQIYDLGQMTHSPLPGSIFLHYTGAVKPWRLSGRHRLSVLYRNLEARSPWAGSPLLPPAGYKEMEIYARLSMRDGDFAAALRWYWNYLRAKFL